MLARILSTTAVSALTLAIAACSPSAPTTAAAEPATQVAATPTMEAQPISMAAATPAAAADMSGMDHSAHAMAPAEAANPGVAPAPAPVVAPVEDKQPVNAAAVTGHTLPINKIKNFKLADQNGKAYELYKMTDAKAIVLTMHTKGCPIGQQLQPDFKDMQAKYESKGVKFLMLNSNLYDTPAAIAEEVKSFGSTIPVLKDTDQSVGEPLGVERATETLVIQPGTWKILYQGPINDRVTYGRARARAEHQYAGDVLDAMLTGKSVTPSYIAPEGCILVFDNRKS
jgi:peroxiredoxin